MGDDIRAKERIRAGIPVVINPDGTARPWRKGDGPVPGWAPIVEAAQSEADWIHIRPDADQSGQCSMCGGPWPAPAGGAIAVEPCRGCGGCLCRRCREPASTETERKEPDPPAEADEPGS